MEGNKQFRILPATEKLVNQIITFKTYNKAQAEVITEQGHCIIEDLIEKLKEGGIDTCLKTKVVRYPKL